MPLKGSQCHLMVNTREQSQTNSKVACNLQRYGAACCVLGIPWKVIDRKDGGVAIEDCIVLAYLLYYIMHGASYDWSITEQKMLQSALNLTNWHQQQS